MLTESHSRSGLQFSVRRDIIFSELDVAPPKNDGFLNFFFPEVKVHKLCLCIEHPCF